MKTISVDATFKAELLRGLGGQVVSVSVFQSAFVRVGRFESRSPLGRATLPTAGASVNETRSNLCVCGCEIVNKRGIWAEIGRGADPPEKRQ